MAQLHCLLPYFGNQMSVNNNYKQHIQGIINHGRNLTLYRTFNNIYNGANLSIHCWLLSLEEIYKSNNDKLPDTIFCQIDGGSENANWVVKGICELLVARGLTKQVIMTRLPPGHTHEDIDAVFGTIWEHLKGRTIYSPQGYERALYVALRERNVDVKVIDILCVPDYKLYMKEYVDPALARCDKEKWSELQWIFDKVNVSEQFPSGVKVMYRKFSADEVFIINELHRPTTVREEKESSEDAAAEEQKRDTHEVTKETESNRLWNAAPPEAREYGFDYCKVRVNSHPRMEKDGEIEGMYILRKLPDGTKPFLPQAFLEGSRKALEDLARNICGSKKYGNIPGVRDEWIQWVNYVAPMSDDATEYCLQHPLVIPLKQELFSGSTVDVDVTVLPIRPAEKCDLPPEYETSNSVLWSNRGRKSKIDLVNFNFNLTLLY